MATSSVYSFRNVVRGYHVYMNDWTPAIGDEFQAEIEELNVHDRYNVSYLATRS